MPPPPPSASYLWKFDDLSSSDDDDNDEDSSSVDEQQQQLLKFSRHSEVVERRVEDDFVDVPPEGATQATELRIFALKEDTMTLSPKIASVPPKETADLVAPPTALGTEPVSSSNFVATLTSPTESLSIRSSSSPLPPQFLNTTRVAAVTPANDESDNNYDLENNDRTIIKPSCEDAFDKMTDTTIATSTGDVEESMSGDSDEDPMEEESDCQNTTTTTNNKTSTKGTRKRKKGKKKKKKTKNAADVTSTAATVAPPMTVTTNRKGVSFSSVHVLSFERCLGSSVVPGDGGWPLGMGQETGVCSEAEQICTVSDYERSKQERLLHRLHQTQHVQQHVQQQSPPSSPSKEAAGDERRLEEKSFMLMPHLETRQWDYKHKCKNPLFGALMEDERMHLLLAASAASEPPPAPHDTSRDSPTRSNKHHVRRNTRSHSIDSTNSNSNGCHPVAPCRSRSRSGSVSAITTEHYNDVYTQVEVHHCRNELEQIRNSRTMEGSTGCTCRKLQVYLLPPNAGKKAHHRRLKPQKVKEELRKRHLLPPNADNNSEHINSHHSREELELLLHDAVEQEPCCRADSCPCARNGIECQADACTCWYSSHQTKRHQQQQQQHGSETTMIITPAEIKTRCGNPVAGMYVVDLEKVDAFRSNYLSALQICPEIVGVRA